MTKAKLISAWLLALVLLIPAQVPGAMTTPALVQQQPQQYRAAVLLRLDGALEQLGQQLKTLDTEAIDNNGNSIGLQSELKDIEDLWRQLFETAPAPGLNKTYNQFQQVASSLGFTTAFSLDEISSQILNIRAQLRQAL